MPPRPASHGALLVRKSGGVSGRQRAQCDRELAGWLAPAPRAGAAGAASAPSVRAGSRSKLSAREESRQGRAVPVWRIGRRRRALAARTCLAFAARVRLPLAGTQSRTVFLVLFCCRFARVSAAGRAIPTPCALHGGGLGQPRLPYAGGACVSRASASPRPSRWQVFDAGTACASSCQEEGCEADERARGHLRRRRGRVGISGAASDGNSNGLRSARRFSRQLAIAMAAPISLLSNACISPLLLSSSPPLLLSSSPLRRRCSSFAYRACSWRLVDRRTQGQACSRRITWASRTRSRRKPSARPRIPWTGRINKKV